MIGAIGKNAQMTTSSERTKPSNITADRGNSQKAVAAPNSGNCGPVELGIGAVVGGRHSPALSGGSSRKGELTEDEEQLARKRAYNRANAARARKRTKENIANLTAKVEEAAVRIQAFERQTQELTHEVRRLSDENQRLRELVVVVSRDRPGHAPSSAASLTNFHPGMDLAGLSSPGGEDLFLHSLSLRQSLAFDPFVGRNVVRRAPPGPEPGAHSEEGRSALDGFIALGNAQSFPPSSVGVGHLVSNNEADQRALLLRSLLNQQRNADFSHRFKSG